MGNSKNSTAERLGRIEAKLEAVDRIEMKLDAVIETNNVLKTDLEVHKVKSGFWGAIGGVFTFLASKLLGS